MANPFATVADLTGRGLTITNQPSAEQFLDDASNELRSQIGWQVYPPATLTVTVTTDSHGRVRLPGAPVAAVTAVLDDRGGTVPAGRYRLVDGQLETWHPGCRLTVTYTVGYATPPADLVSWTCVLAAQMLARAALADGSMGATPASLAVDDFRIGFSAQQQAGESPIPPRVLERLRSTYGTGVYVA